MKMILSLLIVLSSQTPFYGKSYVVYFQNNQQVLASQKLHDTQSVASISKIMTAILVIENNKLDKEVIVDSTIKKAYGSCVYIHIGDHMTVQDLLYGLMLRSGNDCALMLAKVTGGSIDNFVDMMNAKAKQLRMSDSLFKNPSGLDEEDGGNISSVYDMALLYDYCSQNVIFNTIVSTKTYKRLDKKGSWHNKNRLLDLYPYCTGGKTGYTKIAKRTLVTQSTYKGKSLIIVTFRCGNDFEYHQNQYEYWFSKIKTKVVFPKGKQTIEGIDYFLDEDLTVDTSQNVTYTLKNNVMTLYNNQQIIKKQHLKRYHMIDYIKMIFKDLMNV